MLSIFSWIWSFGHLRYVLVITILKNQKKKNKNSYYWRKFKKKRAAYLNKHDHDVARDGKVVGHKW